MFAFMVPYSLYELERGIDRNRLRRSDEAIGRLAEALQDLGRLAAGPVARLFGTLAPTAARPAGAGKRGEGSAA